MANDGTLHKWKRCSEGELILAVALQKRRGGAGEGIVDVDPESLSVPPCVYVLEVARL